jgi:ATP-dependent helicase/nuclease subunit A
MSAAYFIDGQLADSADFYTRACDPARSVVVEACAGAGKTWMLVSRILRALLAGAEPQQIVAITFTRKAAGEMRERLSKWLGDFALASAETRIAELRLRGMSEAEARTAEPRLAGLHEHLLRGGRFVEIRTFHAWFAQLLRAAPLDLLRSQGISPELQLLEDESELMPELWRRFHRALLADPPLLGEFEEMVQRHGRNKLRDWLLAGFSKRVELRLAQAHDRLMSSMPEASSVLPECADLAHPRELFSTMRDELLALARQLGQAKGKLPQDAASAIERGIDDFDAVFAALFTAKGEPKSRLGDSAEQLAACDRLSRIAAATAQHEAWLDHGRMSRLTLLLCREFDELKRERGLVDMNDIERGALALLGDAELAGWVQQRLDAQLRHLLIDEFQDTSPLQWHALHGWLSSYVGAGAGQGLSVFIVGDPKQSIYRFRRAEPRIFAAAREFVVQGLAGTALACDHTRRNAQGVLDAVNAVFDGEPGFRTHTTAAKRDGGLYKLDVPAAEKSARESRDDWRPSLTEARHEPELARRAVEANEVTHAIRQLLTEGVKPGDIFVLARKREGLRVLSEALRGAGVPHAAPENQALLDSPDVRDLMALLDVLASNHHDLSLAHALRSPLFGVDEGDLLRLAREAGNVQWLGEATAEPRRSWWSALMALESNVSEELNRARRLLATWAEAAQGFTPHELLDAIVCEGELLERLSQRVSASEWSARSHAVQSLLALALDLDGGRFVHLYGFVRALKSRLLELPLAAHGDAVQLLTVHGAKGLEAKVVFLLDADAGPARAETSTLLVDWPVYEQVPRRVAFVSSEAKAPPALQPLLDEERIERQREEMNALYVAMTRAESRLVVSRTVGARAPSSATWWSRLQERATPWVLTEAAEADAAPTRNTLAQLPRWTPPPAAAARPPADDALAARIGEAMHRVLEWSSQPGQRLTVEDLTAACSQMYGLDKPGHERLTRGVQAILASPDCSPFFDATRLAWAGNEVPISYEGQDLRLDRLVKLDGCWWVLDYKLGADPEARPEYIEQMQRYVAAVRVLQPGEEVRAALISAKGRLAVIDGLE